MYEVVFLYERDFIDNHGNAGCTGGAGYSIDCIDPF